MWPTVQAPASSSGTPPWSLWPPLRPTSAISRGKHRNRVWEALVESEEIFVIFEIWMMIPKSETNNETRVVFAVLKAVVQPNELFVLSNHGHLPLGKFGERRLCVDRVFDLLLWDRFRNPILWCYSRKPCPALKVHPRCPQSGNVQRRRSLRSQCPKGKLEFISQK